jgi:hypothetical protein
LEASDNTYADVRKAAASSGIKSQKGVSEDFILAQNKVLQVELLLTLKPPNMHVP